jgi:hypothetical protein
MSEEKQKYTDAQYVEAGEGYFEGDDLTRDHTYKIVKTRKDHECMGFDHKGDRIIPAGSKALCERAIHVDDGRVSCYVCIPCLDEWCADIFR